MPLENEIIGKVYIKYYFYLAYSFVTEVYELQADEMEHLSHQFIVKQSLFD